MRYWDIVEQATKIMDGVTEEPVDVSAFMTALTKFGPITSVRVSGEGAGWKVVLAGGEKVESYSVMK